MSVARQWATWRAGFAKLSRRERGISFAAAFIGVLMLGQTYFIDPLLAQRKTLRTQVATLEAEATTLRTLVGVLEQAGSAPSAADQAALDAMLGQVAEQDAALRTIRANLVSPREVPALLEALLSRQHGLHLIALQTLPVESVAIESATAQATTPPVAAEANAGRSASLDSNGLYRHGFSLTVRGRYADLARYVGAIERSQPRLLWQAVALDAEKHPVIDLTLQVYTLSLDPAWLAF